MSASSDERRVLPSTRHAVARLAHHTSCPVRNGRESSSLVAGNVVLETRQYAFAVGGLQLEEIASRRTQRAIPLGQSQRPARCAVRREARS